MLALQAFAIFNLRFGLCKFQDCIQNAGLTGGFSSGSQPTTASRC